MAQMTGAHYLATALERYGLTEVFVVPTIASETLVAIEQHTDIRRIVPHSEKSAAYMADGYARASGLFGVCGAQTVGRANLAAGLQDAYLACSPVLALTGGPLPHSPRSRHVYQEIDAFPMFGSVTKSSVYLESVDHLPQVFRQAVRTATTGKPGPVHIELQGHAADHVEAASAELDDHLDLRFGATPPFRPAPEAGAVEEALRQIDAAQRPILVAGGGVRTSGAAAELVALAERLSLPVATSLNAKEIIPGDHPLSAGVVGLYSRKSANATVWEADLVVFVGSQTSSQVTFNWQVPPPTTPVVHIDIDPAELGRHYAHTTPVLGDAKVVLQRMLDAGSEPRDRSAWLERVAQLRGEYFDEYREQMESDVEPMRPERLCRELSDLLPSDALLLADTGHAGMWTGGMVDLRHPTQGYLRAAGSLGWGVPAAIGAKCGAPDRPVVLFTGDGGFWYHATELETACRWNIPVVLLVNDNRSLNQEIGPYTLAYGGRLHGRHHELWHFNDVDLAAVARSMGATGIRVTRPGQLGDALSAALEADGPAVIDVVTDIDVVAPVAYLPEG
jgi:acetolactate synthase I/II/III large subunit